MRKKKQNNIGEFDLRKALEFDLCSAAHKLEFEIEPGYRLYFPWLHREYWQEQEDEARTKQGENRLNREGTERKKRNRSRERSENLARKEHR